MLTEVIVIKTYRSSPHTDLVQVDGRDEQLLNQVVELGDKNQRTLGFHPRVAFQKAAEAGTLVAAVREGQAVGYVLYALPRQIVRITHLCIAEDVRGEGIARRLIDAVSERHADRLGIILSCRNDYPAHAMWPNLGFEPLRERPGRSQRGSTLTVWRRDHGHPDLFSVADSAGVLRVVLDVNVFLDLEASTERTGVTASRALADDWLTDQVELVTTPELVRELARKPDGHERSRQHRAAANYHRLAVDARAADVLARRIIEQVIKTQGIDLGSGASDQSVVRQLVETSLAGVTVLATKDKKFQDWASGVVGETGVRVMHPADVILAVDELARAQAYRPAQLHDTMYRLVPVRSGVEDDLLAFLHTSQGEQKPHFLDLIRRIAAGGPRWSRLVLRDPADNPVALYATGESGYELAVPLLRIATPRLEQTLTRQIVFQIRDQARREGRSIVRITEPSLADETQRILREDGFLRLGDSWITLVVRVCGDSSTVNASISQAAELAELRLQTLQSDLSAVIAADIERTMWPAKIIDSQLPTYVITIKPSYSSDLFGIPQTLTPRPNMLGLSREHVYYRGPKPATRAPARLIWYVTNARRGGVSAIIGTSRLEETITDKPLALFQRFRHLGVWQLQQIAEAAKDGKAEALRFADTEIFPHPLSLREIRQLEDEHQKHLALQSPQQISADLFAAIYQRGHRPSDAA